MRKFVTPAILLCSAMLIGALACHSNTDGSTADSDKINYHRIMADSEIARRGERLDYGGSDPSAKWRYTTGLFLKSILAVWEATDDQKYFAYVQRVIDSFIADDGTIATYKISDYNIDKINSGKVLLALYSTTGTEKYKLAADILRGQLADHPRTQTGGFWHKQRYPWQMWLDGIYMGAPFYAGYSKMFNDPAGFDDVVNQILLIDVQTRDPETGLRYHAWDESKEQRWANPVTGTSPHFWGRAMGWYAMAIVDVLDYVPEDHIERSKILFILDDLVGAIKNYQDNSGLWYQVVDLGDREGNYLEASASAMFVYAIAKGVNQGYLDSKYWQVAETGFDGLVNNLISVNENGAMSLNQVCAVAGLGGDPYRDGSYEYYIGEPVVANDLKGVGPFILASIELAMGKSN
ncbi:glycoside hydrolase family 105 protein [Candidatus Neomarinimicrobiota bacterium]